MQGKRRNDAPAGDARGVLDRLEDRGMAIARLAARQRGQVTRSQLLSVGLGSGAIEQHLRDGRLHRIRRLRALIDDRPALTRSEAEERLLALIREAELPAPEVNVGLGPYIVDFLWRDHRLAVEVDGFVAHSSRKAFERDRRRDADLAAQGYTVVRVTWRQIVDAPGEIVARIGQALAVRRSGSDVDAGR